MFKKPASPSTSLKDRISKVSQRPTPEAAADKAGSQSGPKPRASRSSVFRNGTLMFGDGQRMSVAIKDLSKTGARIEFFRYAELPKSVVLIEPTLKLRRKARVAWQRELVAGLEFIDD